MLQKSNPFLKIKLGGDEAGISGSAKLIVHSAKISNPCHCEERSNPSKYLGKINCVFVIATETKHSPVPRRGSRRVRCGSSQHFEITSLSLVMTQIILHTHLYLFLRHYLLRCLPIWVGLVLWEFVIYIRARAEW